MNFWVMKSEPSTYGINDLAVMKNQTDHWDGVRNYQVRNMLRDQMKVGDLAFFYHSNCAVPGIVGVVEVVKEGYVDFTAFDADSKYYDPKSTEDNPRWFMVDVRLVSCFSQVISLHALKENPALSALPLVKKGNRLSICQMNAYEWQQIVAMLPEKEQVF